MTNLKEIAFKPNEIQVLADDLKAMNIADINPLV